MANLEAGTSSDVAPAFKCDYDVFLNFRGEDTRHGFAGFLYRDLVNARVRVFRDEDEVKVGEVIGGELLRAINNSTIYIPIFSQTYASSKWCLRELAYIVDEYTKSEGQKCILPIFFHVEPKHLKLKTPLYSDALSNHKKKFPDEVKEWRNALAVVDEIKGWNVKKDQSQEEIVKLVVEKVLEKLEMKQKSVIEHLVGIDDRVKDLTVLLDVNHCDMRLIGIYGVGGIGKTTVAKVIFNQLSSHFGKRCSFLADVRETSSTNDGIVQLQRKLLTDIVGFGSAEKVKDSEQGARTIEETFRTKKVLVVLDDVDNKEHIKKLIGNSVLRLGSRIIITTRNKSLLQVEGFEGKILRYEMPKMDDGPARQFFCRHAFGRDFPCDDFHGLSSEIVSCTGGLPLAIKVIGSLLNGRNKAFWKKTLANLRRIPEKEILKKLMISYNDLNTKQKEIFLDIACFFVNEKKIDAIYMWDDCKFYSQLDIHVLTSRCLIKILDNDKFWMHDQLIKLGRQIVLQVDIGEPSRQWIATKALQIIRSEKRKYRVQALQIDGLDDSIEITNEEFERLQILRFLKLRNGTFAGNFGNCPSQLRWISWHPPLQDFRAANICFDHLVVFKLGANGFMEDSNAWDFIRRARNLKVLYLTDCYGITTIPDFSQCLALERVTLARCYRLKRIESFIGNLQLLIELKIEACRALTGLPIEVGALVKLQHFSLSGCSGLRELPNSLGKLTSLIELDLSCTGITELPKSIKGLVNLESLLLTDTRIKKFPNYIRKLKSLRVLGLSKHGSYSREHHVWQLPSGISMLENLEELDLSGRDEVKGEIPSGLGALSSLKILNLEGTQICGIPRTIHMLHHLQTLNLRYCNEIQDLPELPTSLTCLLLQSDSLLFLPNLSNLTNLVELLLCDGSLLTSCNFRWIGRLSKLKKLDLQMLNVPVPPELASLSYLEELTLSHLYLETPVRLPSSLLRLHLKFFKIRRADSVPFFLRLRNLSTLVFNYGEVEDIPLDGLPQLENLTVHGCRMLQRLSIPLELRRLQQVRVSSCPDLVEIQVEGLSISLESFFVFRCKSLRRIGGLSYLKNLEKLEILWCKLLTNVESLNELESLESLEVRSCTSLRRLIDASCTNIPDDCLVQIQGCGNFIKDSAPGHQRRISLKHYRKEILLNTQTSNSNQTRCDIFFINI